LKGLPGTPILELSGPYGMAYQAAPPYEVVETAALSRVGLNRLKNFARFWELLVNRGLIRPGSASLPAGKPVFAPFMALSDALLARFGRNWGIDRAELLETLAEFIHN
jgi:hypothetical protein